MNDRFRTQRWSPTGRPSPTSAGTSVHTVEGREIESVAGIEDDIEDYIEEHSEGRCTTTRLIGHIHSEHLGWLQALMQGRGPRIVLDLDKVTLVDVDVVRFLSVCEAEGSTIRHGPPTSRSGCAASKTDKNEVLIIKNVEAGTDRSLPRTRSTRICSRSPRRQRPNVGVTEKPYRSEGGALPRERVVNERHHRPDSSGSPCRCGE